jgi:protein-disulfide isomerase
MDSAQFDSCIADKDGEAAVVEVRRRGAEEAKVNSTPSFYIDGVKLGESPEIDSFRDALKAK